jgi:hypothetical protein
MRFGTTQKTIFYIGKSLKTLNIKYEDFLKEISNKKITKGETLIKKETKS